MDKSSDSGTPTEELAREWWKNRELAGSEGTRELGDSLEESSARYEFDEDVDDFVSRADTFGQMIELLARTAPSKDALAYLGTAILEDGYAVHGAYAFVALEESVIDADVRNNLLSGFRF
jgi:hypothetical protein